MGVYVMLGLFKGDRFEYARALIDVNLNASVVVEPIAEALRCSEKLDKRFSIYIPSVGFAETDGICVIDRAIINGSHIELKTIFHVIKSDILKPLHCEAILGRDIAIWWRLTRG